MYEDSEAALKLRLIDKNTWQTLPKSSWLKNLTVSGSATLQPMESTYYDTPSRSLWKAYCSYRIHNEGNGWLATLAQKRPLRGRPHHLQEWNISLPGPELNPEIIVQMPGDPKIMKLLHGQSVLEPLFKTIFSRWQVLVNFQNGAALFELSMDRGVISSEDKNEDINEVKIKLRSGTTKDLFSFVSELTRRFPLLLENRNKYHRGLCLTGLSVRSHKKVFASWPPTSAAFWDEAIGTVLESQTDCFAKSFAVEELHVLRVSLRKLRTYLTFTAPLFTTEAVTRWKEVLGKWSRCTAKIRELDVLLEEWTHTTELCGIDNSNSQLTAYWNEQRKKQVKSLNTIIAKGKLTNDLLTFRTWISTENNYDEADPGWNEFSRQRLEKWLRKLRQNLGQVDISDAEAMHNLRIRGKKFRYIMELYAQRYDTRDTLHLLAELKDLQDCLGDLQDTAQSVTLFKQGSQDLALRNEFGCLNGWQARRRYSALLRFRMLSKKFKSILKQWLKG